MNASITLKRKLSGAVSLIKKLRGIATMANQKINGGASPYPKHVGPSAICSFPDGADGAPLKSLKFNIEPQQNLNGYDYPWPGGGGKNLLALNLSPVRTQILTNVTASEQTENKVTLVSTSNTYAFLRLFYHLKAGTYTLSLKATSSDSYTPEVSIYHYASPYSLIVGSITQATPKSFTLSADADVDIRFFVTGSTAAVRTVTFSEVQLESGSPATAYAPYSNICPITGWTQCDAWKDGKNLLDSTIGFTTAGGLTYTRNSDDGTIYVSGTATATSYIVLANRSGLNDYQTPYLLAGMQIKCSTGTTRKINVRYTDGTFGTFSNDTTVTLAKDVGVFYIQYNSGEQSNETLYPMIRFASDTDATYISYNGTPITIALGQTVYGGTVDVLAGKAYARPYYSSYSGQTLVGPWVSSHDVYVSGGTPTTGAQVVDMGGAVTEISVTAQQVSSLLGQNNIWCNTGDTELDYYPAQSSMVAVWDRTRHLYVSIPLKYIRYDTYQINPQQAIDLDSYRSETGTLIRNVVGSKCKIEFNTPMMDDAKWSEVWSILSAGFNNTNEKKLKLKYYDTQSGSYKYGYFYVPDVQTPIRSIDEPNGIINYNEIRIAFIEY